MTAVYLSVSTGAVVTSARRLAPSSAPRSSAARSPSARGRAAAGQLRPSVAAQLELARSAAAAELQTSCCTSCVTGRGPRCAGAGRSAAGSGHLACSVLAAGDQELSPGLGNIA